MNIGLVRHFKVNHTAKLFMTSSDFEEWAKQYDLSDITENEMSLRDLEWNKCFSSNLPRAIKTAQTIFKGSIIETHLLREVPIYPIFKSNLKLPYVFWLICGRLAWLFNHKSQTETKEMTKQRILEFLDIIDHDETNNLLVVCHGFFMYALQKELKMRNFSGENIKTAQNGTLYLYMK